MNRNKFSAVILASTLLFAACGNSADTKKGTDTASATPAASTASSASTSSDKGLELIGASDCTTCHRIHQADNGANLGPAYDQVAAKYSPAADTTIARLVKKIQTGGSGVWGTTPMSAHTALKEEDIKTMVSYILSLKK